MRTRNVRTIRSGSVHNLASKSREVHSAAAAKGGSSNREVEAVGFLAAVAQLSVVGAVCGEEEPAHAGTLKSLKRLESRLAP